ncbi:UNVERIFIED_CONTAM: hypothetical protein PYX00_005970 [Menopon gallinae]|uniref:Histone deacetylase complex subunit SAP30 homolog n=1 Tax=Menopon gallinae TaxID=328185 RepID=A0AAW2HTW6_9NEOP
MTMNGFSTGEDDSRGASDQICCLLDENDRCKRPAGNASYNKRIQKTVTQRRLKLRIDNLATHIYICDFHKAVIQNARTKRRRKDSEDDSNEQLQLNTLKRYKKHFKISSKPTMNKTQLAETLMKHLKTIPVVEKETLTFFIYMVKSNSNKLDQKNGIGENT